VSLCYWFGHQKYVITSQCVSRGHCMLLFSFPMALKSVVSVGHPIRACLMYAQASVFKTPQTSHICLSTVRVLGKFPPGFPVPTLPDHFPTPNICSQYLNQITPLCNLLSPYPVPLLFTAYSAWSYIIFIHTHNFQYSSLTFSFLLLPLHSPLKQTH
jgi:hypothetical protein